MKTDTNTDYASKVHELIGKAVDAPKSEDAMRFTQAACNAANALAVLSNINKN
jgi:hypothetical protein